MSLAPNAGPEPRLEAEATEERTLEGLGSRPWFGSVRLRITPLSYTCSRYIRRSTSGDSCNLDPDGLAKILLCNRLSQPPFPRPFPRAPLRRHKAVCMSYPLASDRRLSSINVRPNVHPDELDLLQAEDTAPRWHLALAVEDGVHEARVLVRPQTSKVKCYSTACVLQLLSMTVRAVVGVDHGACRDLFGIGFCPRA